MRAKEADLAFESLPKEVQTTLLIPAVTDVCLRHDTGHYDQGYGMETIKNYGWTEAHLRKWVLDTMSGFHKTWDAKNPFIDLLIPGGNARPPLRLHVVMPPIHEYGILLSFRKLQALTPFSWKTDPAYPLLQNSFLNKKTWIIAGATGSGKTTLARELIESLPHTQRILAIEDTPELLCKHPQYFSLSTRSANADGHGALTLSTLIKQCLRMRPDRILLGECRGSEALDFLQTVHTGHAGSLVTIHANSAKDALKRLEFLCLLASGNGIETSIFRALVGSGIHGVCFVNRADPGRQISELIEISGMEGSTLLLRSVYALRTNYGLPMTPFINPERIK